MTSDHLCVWCDGLRWQANGRFVAFIGNACSQQLNGRYLCLFLDKIHPVHPIDMAAPRVSDERDVAFVVYDRPTELYAASGSGLGWKRPLIHLTHRHQVSHGSRKNRTSRRMSSMDAY